MERAIRPYEMDDVVDISQPMFTDISARGTVDTIKERIDAIQTAIVELHKCGETFPGEGEEISKLIAQHAISLASVYRELANSYRLADAS